MNRMIEVRRGAVALVPALLAWLASASLRSQQPAGASSPRPNGWTTPMSVALGAGELEALKHDAEAGNNEAAYRLAVYYGLGRQDLDGQLKWLRLGAARGHVQSRTDLGLLLVTGNAPGGKTAQNTREGLAWWKMAADSGSIGAMKSLADHYEREPDSSMEAIYWRKRANGLDDISATRELARERLQARGPAAQVFTWMGRYLVLKLQVSLREQDVMQRECAPADAECAGKALAHLAALSQDADLLSAVTRLQQAGTMPAGRKAVRRLAKAGHEDAVLLDEFLSRPSS